MRTQYIFSIFQAYFPSTLIPNISTAINLHYYHTLTQTIIISHSDYSIPC